MKKISIILVSVLLTCGCQGPQENKEVQVNKSDGMFICRDKATGLLFEVRHNEEVIDFIGTASDIDNSMIVDSMNISVGTSPTVIHISRPEINSENLVRFQVLGSNGLPLTSIYEVGLSQYSTLLLFDLGPNGTSIISTVDTKISSSSIGPQKSMPNISSSTRTVNIGREIYSESVILQMKKFAREVVTDVAISATLVTIGYYLTTALATSGVGAPLAAAVGSATLLIAWTAAHADELPPTPVRMQDTNYSQWIKKTPPRLASLDQKLLTNGTPDSIGYYNPEWFINFTIVDPNHILTRQYHLEFTWWNNWGATNGYKWDLWNLEDWKVGQLVIGSKFGVGHFDIYADRSCTIHYRVALVSDNQIINYLEFELPETYPHGQVSSN